MSSVIESAMCRRNALLIVNPCSRRGRDECLVGGLSILEKAGININRQDSRSSDHAKELILKAPNTVDMIIIGGGDGTISSVAPALKERKLPFAILPLGTANDLSRTLSIPPSIEGACEVILDGNKKRIDLGLVNGCYFFNVANIGLGVEITSELTPQVKKSWGVLSYLIALFNALSRRKSFRVNIDVDGKRYKSRSIQIAVGNGQYYGGGNMIDDNARIESGELCLYSLKPQSFWRLLLLAPLFRLGRHRASKNVYTACGKNITISTKNPVEIHADGDPIGKTPAHFKILHKAVEVFAPEENTCADI